jgi:hypothetical protein
MAKLILPLISDETPVKLPTVLACVTSGPSPTTFSQEGKINKTAANNNNTTDNFFIVLIF